MIVHPFSILAAHDDNVNVVFLTKSDNVRTDADTVHITGAKNIASLKQMHGSNVEYVTQPSSRTLEADGLLTDQPNLTLTVRFADCQAFVLYEPQKRVLGLLHVGWRCLVAGTIPSFFRQLKDRYDIAGHNVLVGAAPSLCKKCADFTNPHTEVPSLKKYIDGKHVDLIAAADDQLSACGVLPTNIERIAGCTRCLPKEYWTYRGGDHDKVKDGYTNCFVAQLVR